MSEADQVRREVMAFRQRLDGWGWVGTEVFEESPVCYRVESTPMCHQPKQQVWIYWNVDGVTAQAEPPKEQYGDGVRAGKAGDHGDGL